MISLVCPHDGGISKNELLARRSGVQHKRFVEIVLCELG